MLQNYNSIHLNFYYFFQSILNRELRRPEVGHFDLECLKMDRQKFMKKDIVLYNMQLFVLINST